MCIPIAVVIGTKQKVVSPAAVLVGVQFFAIANENDEKFADQWAGLVRRCPYRQQDESRDWVDAAMPSNSCSTEV